MASMIQKGDQFNLPFKVKMGDTYVSPSNADDVRIKIDDTLKQYSRSEITFDSSTNEWLFPMTQNWTRLKDKKVAFLVGVKIGNNIFYSKTMSITVGPNIIEEVW